MDQPEQYQVVIDHINALSLVWQDRLGLSHFKITHVFLDAYDKDDHTIVATAETQWAYLTARIKWQLPAAATLSLDDLETYIVHELSHVLLAPEQTLINKRLEKECDGLDWVESEALQEQYFDRLEMATEACSRALLAGWGTAQKRKR